MAILRLTLSNRRNEIPRIKLALAEFLDEEGVRPTAINRVKLVIEELVVNVIQHGYEDEAKHSILLDVRTEPRGVVIVVEDDGKPFDPRNVPAPVLAELLEAGRSGGLGVTIIRKMTRELEYQRVEGKNHVRAFVEFASQPDSN
jgi:anti-sigma regulatory factor (Ser/Thr protein kinase)